MATTRKPAPKPKPKRKPPRRIPRSPALDALTKPAKPPKVSVEVHEILSQVRYTLKHDGRPIGTHVLPIAKVPAGFWPEDREIPLVIADELDANGQPVRNHLEWATIAAIEKRVAGELAANQPPAEK